MLNDILDFCIFCAMLWIILRVERYIYRSTLEFERLSVHLHESATRVERATAPGTIISASQRKEY